MINDLTNVVYHINGTRLAVVTKSGEGYWRFNTVTGEFEVAPSEGTGWGNMAITKSGHDSWSQTSVYPVEALEQSQIAWRLVEV